MDVLFSPLVCRAPSHIFCWAGLVATNSSSLFWPWEVFISPSVIVGSCVGYSSLRWHLLSLRAWNAQSQSLLALEVSVGSSAMILGGPPLWVTWCLSVPTYNLLSLSCIFSVLIKIWGEKELFSLVCLVLNASYICTIISFPNSGKFSVMILFTLMRFFPSSMLITHTFGSFRMFVCPDILPGPFLLFYLWPCWAVSDLPPCHWAQLCCPLTVLLLGTSTAC